MPGSSSRDYVPTMSTVSTLSEGIGGEERDYEILPPSTGGDDGSPSDSLLKDVQRVLALIQDERHLVAHDLYCDISRRVHQTPSVDLSVASHKRRLHVRRHARKQQKAAREAKENEDRAAKELFASKKAEFEKLETVARLFRNAKQDLTEEGDWIFSQTLFGVDTHYRREEDGSLSIKIEGSLDGVPLFEQVAVLREVDLHKKWAPFCTSSMTIKQLDKIDVVGWFVTGLPNFGIMRDGCFRAIGCDSIWEDGTVVLVGQGVEDRKPDEEDREPSDATYLADDPAVKELDMPPVPTRLGAGRMTIQKFEAIIEILSPTSAKTLLVANINPNLDFIPQSLIDFLMKKLCGVLVNRLQTAASKCAKDPIKNAHARRMREERDFYEGWLKPKFQGYGDAQGWELSPVTALELTEEQQEKADKYQEAKSVRRAISFNGSNGTRSRNNSENSVATQSEPVFRLADDDTEVSDISSTSSVWRNNPIAGYLREVERKAEMRKAENIAKARKRAAARLKRSKLTGEELERLKELKQVKARRLQQNASTTGESPVNGRAAEGTAIDPLGWSERLHHHQPYTRLAVVSTLFAAMVTIFYATSVSARLNVNSTHWWSGLLRNTGAVLYLGVCAGVHFLLCDVSLVYAFESLDLGMKTGRLTKQYYSGGIHLAGAIGSFGVVVGSIIRAVGRSWFREVVWHTLRVRRYIGEVVQPYIYSSVTDAVADANTTATSFSDVVWDKSAWLGSILSTVFSVFATVSSALLEFVDALVIRSHWVGRILQDLFFRWFGLVFSLATSWKDFVDDVVASHEGTLELPTWRSDAIDSSRFLLLHSAVFLLAILFLFNLSTPKQKRPSPSTQELSITRNQTYSQQTSLPSSPASTSENDSRKTEASSQSSRRRQVNRRGPSSPSSGVSELLHTVIHEGDESRDEEVIDAESSMVSFLPDHVTTSSQTTSTRKKKRFRLKKRMFRKKKKKGDDDSEVSLGSSALRKVASDGTGGDPTYPEVREIKSF